MLASHYLRTHELLLCVVGRQCPAQVLAGLKRVKEGLWLIQKVRVGLAVIDVVKCFRRVWTQR